MSHLIKYRFLQIIREGSIMFWALFFPIILGTFFYIAFGRGDVMGEDMEIIPVAVVEEDTSSENAKAFTEFLDSMDGETLDIKTMSEKQALKKLKGDEVTGIYYVAEEPSLAVAQSSMKESILTSILDSYNTNAAMLMQIAATHPERIPDAIAAMTDYRQTTREVQLGGKTIDPNVSYFFALIAYACLSGAFLGIKSSFDGQANLSPLGARRSVTPTHKLKIVLTDMAVLFGIHFVNILILVAYVRFVLGIYLGDNMLQLLAVCLMGSMIGVSMGLMLGCVSKVSVDKKMSLCVLITLFPGFLAGLMIGNIKDIIEHNWPIINRINPAAVLSDAFYCMGVYNDNVRFARNLMILGIMSVTFIIIAFLGVRRERYDSI